MVKKVKCNVCNHKFLVDKEKITQVIETSGNTALLKTVRVYDAMDCPNTPRRPLPLEYRFCPTRVLTPSHGICVYRWACNCNAVFYFRNDHKDKDSYLRKA